MELEFTVPSLVVNRSSTMSMGTELEFTVYPLLLSLMASALLVGVQESLPMLWVGALESADTPAGHWLLANAGFTNPQHVLQ